MRTTIIFLLLSVSFIERSGAQGNEIKSFTWLAGRWQMQTTTGTLLEIWTIESDTSMQGRSFKIRTGGDTVVLESIHLVCHQNKCSYIPMVRGQNQGMPVRFDIIEIGASTFKASNPEHDFPKHIIYRRENEFLYASVSGDEKEIKYHFSRVNE